MNSKKETSPLIATFLCISFIICIFQCTFSQPITTDLFKVNIKENDDGNAVDSIWIRPLSYLDSDELNSEELLQKYHEQDEYNRPSLSSPVRRANFWKRANFWRKRANFWRRDLAA